MNHHDEALIRRAMRGDAEALDILWRSNRCWATSVVVAHSPDGTEIEDLVQEVALTFVRGIAALKAPRAFRPWLRTIAVNVARDAMRRRNSGLRTIPLLVPDPCLATQDEEEERRVARAEIERVQEAIAALPVHYREPRILKSVDGLSQRAVAEILGVPETTVENRLARARRMLRKALARNSGHREPHMPRREMEQ